MEKIIKGKKYNTETAEEIDVYSNGYNRRDFRWEESTLYRKKTGEFFVYSEGGPLSVCREHSGDGYTGGYIFHPIEEWQAKEWLEKYGSVESYERVFGKVDE